MAMNGYSVRNVLGPPQMASVSGSTLLGVR